jgi:hypothetical protein
MSTNSFHIVLPRFQLRTATVDQAREQVEKLGEFLNPDLGEPWPEIETPRVMGLSEILALEKSAEDEHTPTVAVDLDGTIAQDGSFDPKRIRDPRPGVAAALREFRRRGYRIIVFTVRGDEQLIRRYLGRHGLEYDYINENPDQPDGSSGKVFADVYIDDRAVAANQSWKKIRAEVAKRIKKAGDQGYVIKSSSISGLGVFADRDYQAGARIGTASVRQGEDSFGRPALALTQLGRFLNYGEDANTKLAEDEAGGYDLVAKTAVKKGEEFLASPNYREEHKAMGLPDKATLLNGTKPGTVTKEPS